MGDESEPDRGKRRPGEVLRGLYLFLRRHGFALLLFAVGATITFGIRWSLLGFHSRDLDDCILPWCDSIRKLGLARALKEGGIDYNPTYIYFLWLASRLPMDRVVSVKLFSMLCDYACAMVLAMVVYRLSRSRLRAFFAGFALLLAPTVIFNSALWGQCDMLFAVFLVIAIAFFLRGRDYLTTAFFGLSVAVKLQAVFLFPMLGIWLIRKEIRWRSLLPLPVIFFLCLVPAWIAGARFADLLMIYPHQMQHYDGLNMNAPGIYNWFPDDGQWITPFGTWFAVGIVFMLAVACMRTKEQVSSHLAIKESLLFSCVAPFLMPHMHERYIFLGDVLCILYAFTMPRRAWVSLLVIGSSLVSYFQFLFGKTPVPLGIAAVMLGVVCVFLTFEVLDTLYHGLFAGRLARDAPDGTKKGNNRADAQLT